MVRTLLAVFATVLAASPALAATTGNLAINPGAEAGADPWTQDITYHAPGPVDLGFTALSASEGLAFFYSDRTWTFLNGTTTSGSITQTVDVRGLGPIESVQYGGDLALVADVLAGSGEVTARPLVFVEFRNEAKQFLAIATGYEDPIDPSAGLAVFDDLRYSAVVPPETAFLVFGLQDNISLVSDPAMQLEVRFVNRIDDAYLALTLPEPEPAAAGAAVLAALGACAAARRRR